MASSCIFDPVDLNNIGRPPHAGLDEICGSARIILDRFKAFTLRQVKCETGSGFLFSYILRGLDSVARVVGYQTQKLNVPNNDIVVPSEVVDEMKPKQTFAWSGFIRTRSYFSGVSDWSRHRAVTNLAARNVILTLRTHDSGSRLISCAAIVSSSMSLM